MRMQIQLVSVQILNIPGEVLEGLKFFLVCYLLSIECYRLTNFHWLSIIIDSSVCLYDTREALPDQKSTGHYQQSTSMN